jgi:hypothetical protein
MSSSQDDIQISGPGESLTAGQRRHPPGAKHELVIYSFGDLLRRRHVDTSMIILIFRGSTCLLSTLLRAVMSLYLSLFS